MINQDLLKAEKGLLKARIRYHKVSIKVLRLKIRYYLNRSPNQINQLRYELEEQINILTYYRNQLANFAT
jgi:hypothetical protein